MPAARNALSQRTLGVWVARGSHTEPPFPPFYLVSTFLPRFHPVSFPNLQWRCGAAAAPTGSISEQQRWVKRGVRVQNLPVHLLLLLHILEQLPLGLCCPWQRLFVPVEAQPVVQKKGVFHLLLIKSSASERAAPRALMVYVDQGKW